MVMSSNRGGGATVALFIRKRQKIQFILIYCVLVNGGKFRTIINVCFSTNEDIPSQCPLPQLDK